MAINYPLNLIYSFTSTANGEQPQQGRYIISYFFSPLGYIPMDVNQRAYKKLFSDEQNIFNGFESLKDLEQFAIEVCKEINAPEVYILSNHDYNATMDTINTLGEFTDLFKRYGTCLKNTELKEGKSGFLGNIFS